MVLLRKKQPNHAPRLQAATPQQHTSHPDLGWHLHATAESRLRNTLHTAKIRLRLVLSGFMLLFLVLAAQLFNVSILTPTRNETATTTPKNTATAMAGLRADITDRNGQLLATSLPVMSLYADGLAIIEPEKTADRIRTVLPELERTKLIADLKSKKRFLWLRRALTPQQHQALHNLGLPGISFEQEYKRVYPLGPLFVHTLGYLDVDGMGIAGLEKNQQERLRADTTPLRLSLDMRLQHIMKRELNDAITEFSAIGGAGIIMDATNGEILSLVSLPDFDPHNPATASDDAKFNRNTLGIYEMGSTFKIFNTALALESGKVKLSDRFDATKSIRIGRFTISDFHPENRWLDVPEIMQHSSNIGSVRMLQQVGIEAQEPFMRELGMTRQVPLELPERGLPLIPNPWREINAMTIAFGHGMAVSPLHLARAVAAMVNGGTLIKPTLLKQNADDVIIGERVVSSRTSDAMRQLLRLVVSEGTAKSADATGYLVGGKTGTAEKLAGKHYNRDARLSSFVGAFPINDPRYVIFVMLDEPKPTKKTFGYATGGWVAAPVVGRVVAQMAPLLGLLPQAVPESEKKPAQPAAAPESDFTLPLEEQAPTRQDNDDDNTAPHPRTPAAAFPVGAHNPHA
jgi:cell division protein FtsI (penicillin-binding protein 3)